MTYIDRKNSIDVRNGYGDDISTIRINGVPFRGVARGSIWGWDELAFTEEPTRTNAGAFENIDEIDVLLVARCEVNFKYMNIQDFMKFREAIKQRYFRCTFFNVDTGEWEYDREMYCSQSEKNELYYFNPNLLGVIDFSIKLVATNRDMLDRMSEQLKVNYHANLNDTSEITASYNVKFGEQHYLLESPNGGSYVWAVGQSERAFKYSAGWSFTVFRDTDLYAVPFTPRVFVFNFTPEQITPFKNVFRNPALGGDAISIKCIVDYGNIIYIYSNCLDGKGQPYIHRIKYSKAINDIVTADYILKLAKYIVDTAPPYLDVANFFSMQYDYPSYYQTHLEQETVFDFDGTALGIGDFWIDADAKYSTDTQTTTVTIRVLSFKEELLKEYEFSQIYDGAVQAQSKIEEMISSKIVN